MATANKTLLQQALEAIFDQRANALPPTTKFATDTVRVTRKVIAPDQGQALAEVSAYFQQYPTLVRSGDSIAIVFSC